MAEELSSFAQELKEVVVDVGREYWVQLPELQQLANGFFHQHAASTLRAPEDTPVDRVATALLLVFLAGREHALRGYRAPIHKEVPDDELDDDVAESLERMTYGEPRYPGLEGTD